MVDVSPDGLGALLDIASSAGAWGAGELLKRIARGRSWEPAARRAIPVVSIGAGAAVRVALEAAIAGADLHAALWRGVGAGAVAIAAQNVRTATIGGAVGAVPDAAPPAEEP